jgi:hypothetical protein
VVEEVLTTMIVAVTSTIIVPRTTSYVKIIIIIKYNTGMV